MPTPAEQYAAARLRQADERSELATFRDRLGFELDDFQLRACRALEAGRGVLVAAPTGAGKTVIGEFAVHLALAGGRKAFYTTPIKALSNQKYAELVAVHGSERVGLLTGDTTVNGEADVVVMTTEVLRNMLYAGSTTLAGLGFVVMDEVHYLADRFRGAVWEEVIIHLPDEVRLVSLSATVSNAEEFGAWLDTVRGDTEVVVEEHRPVPLYQHVLVGNRMHDLFVDGRDAPAVNPDLLQLARNEQRYERSTPSGRGGRGRSAERHQPRQHIGRHGVPRRSDVVSQLERAGLLPAITFIFSRAGCDAAVKQCLDAGIRLTTPEESDRIRDLAEEHTADIPAADLDVLGYWEWLDGLTRGVAAHHAGLLPSFKEVVEQLFAAGLVRCVFATETLALGINMPARTVVLEKLVKWNGETHADITPGEFTQLTGRAGRRGIDVEGHAVVLWHPNLDPRSVAGLASTRTYPLRSSFSPTYNMAVNLVAQVGQQRAREVLETSFAQFQADRAVVGLARQVRTHEEALDGYATAMTCHLGDFAEYAALRRGIKDREAQLSRDRQNGERALTAQSLERVRIGDVLRIPGGRRAGYVVVVEPDRSPGLDGPKPFVLGQDRQIRRLTLAELTSPVEEVTKVRLPKGFNARSPQSRRDLASTLRTAVPHDPPRSRRTRSAGTDPGEDAQLVELRRRMRAHPCHQCPQREDHARWGERWARLRNETDGLQKRIEGRTSSVARTFDRVCAVLSQLGYLDEHSRVTADGERLRRLYTEHDLLVAECLRSGAWRGLDGPGLAAVLSALVYEARREDARLPQPPSGAVGDALDAMWREWTRLEAVEHEHRLSTMRQPDPGLAPAMLRWARGQSLDAVLRDGDLAAGDFVRRCKQLVDLLGQLLGASDAPGTRKAARQAVDGVLRGVVAHSIPG
ncbi:DEAD/DEAH box helicase [Angustibacter sp. McL0619]|uniref:DEAD/DEAH box helicase n=1 Tax=Angustibacter sp. McL0619 TaxID=3415676 RepID=UPI003CF3A07F